jgi:hypothetical protein
LDEQAYVDELSAVEVIEELENDYLIAHGCKTINVSHWDPSPELVRRLESFLDVPFRWPAVNYLFSYDLERGPEVRKALGLAASSCGGLITPSGSASMVCVVNWLAAMGMRQLTVLFPAYFSLRHICRRCDVNVVERFMVRHTREYCLPPLPQKPPAQPSVLWVTNPVYATGVRFAAADICELRRLLDCGWHVVADESLAIAGSELGRELCDHPRFVGIYSPHKSICVNAVKFSLLAFPSQFQRFFDHWADVLYGCLSSSNFAAVDHYLSENFRAYSAEFFARIDQTRAFVSEICVAVPGVELDSSPTGNFATCYFPKIPSRFGADREFLHAAIDSTGASFIPGNRNRFDDAIGFNFRINFAQDSPLFRGTLKRLITHFSARALTNGRDS